MGGRDPLDLEFLESKPKIRTIRVKALVAFGDMVDFGSWTQRGSNSAEDFRSFMVRLYYEFLRFRNGNGYFMKLMGDGFMAIREIKGSNAQKVTEEFIAHSLELEAAVNRIVGETFPTPGKLRIRKVAGHVWKIIASRPGQANSIQTDYLGYPVNLAARLLEIRREKTIVCHGSVKKLLNGGSANKRGFILEQIEVNARCPRGIDPEDLKTLWLVHPLKKSNSAQAAIKRIVPM